MRIHFVRQKYSLTKAHGHRSGHDEVCLLNSFVGYANGTNYDDDVRVCGNHVFIDMIPVCRFGHRTASRPTKQYSSHSLSLSLVLPVGWKFYHDIYRICTIVCER